MMSPCSTPSNFMSRAESPEPPERLEALVEETPKTQITELPDKVLNVIFLLLDGVTLVRSRLVCKQWNDVYLLLLATNGWKTICKQEIRAIDIVNIIEKTHPKCLYGDSTEVNWLNVYIRWDKWRRVKFENWIIINLETAFTSKSEITALKLAGQFIIYSSRDYKSIQTYNCITTSLSTKRVTLPVILDFEVIPLEFKPEIEKRFEDIPKYIDETDNTLILTLHCDTVVKIMNHSLISETMIRWFGQKLLMILYKMVAVDIPFKENDTYRITELPTTPLWNMQNKKKWYVFDHKSITVLIMDKNKIFTINNDLVTEITIHPDFGIVTALFTHCDYLLMGNKNGALYYQRIEEWKNTTDLFRFCEKFENWKIFYELEKEIVTAIDVMYEPKEKFPQLLVASDTHVYLFDFKYK